MHLRFVLFYLRFAAVAIAGCATCGKEDPEQRAGHPFAVSACAAPSDTGH